MTLKTRRAPARIRALEKPRCVRWRPRWRTLRPRILCCVFAQQRRLACVSARPFHRRGEPLVMDRFIQPVRNQYITMTGRRTEVVRPPPCACETSSPTLPGRRSAKSFSRFARKDKGQRTIGARSTATERRTPHLLNYFPGRKSVRSKAVCETKIASRKNTATASR